MTWFEIVEPAPSPQLAVGEGTGAWCEHVAAWTLALRAADRSAGTIRTRTEHVRSFIKAVQAKPLPQVAHQDLIRFAGEKEWSRAYRRSMYTSLAQFFRWAHGEGLIEEDPSIHLPSVRPSKNHGRPASEDGYWNAWARARPREAMMLELASTLGLRRAEVAVVHRRDIIREVHSWMLVVHGKGDKRRHLPIDEALALRLLAACETETGWLFPGKKDGHLSPQRVGNLISHLLPTGETMHSLRHRFAAVYYEATGDVRVVQETLGHENLNTTQLYLPVSVPRMVSALSTAAPLLAPQPPGGRRNPNYAPSPPISLPAAFNGR